MIDIDAHNGEPDAWDAAKCIIDNYCPGAYVERSTHGKGAHIYIVLHVGFIRRQKATSLIKSFVEALALLVKDQGYESSVCGVYGYYSLKENGIIQHRGALAKIPRPQTMEQVETLINQDFPVGLWPTNTADQRLTVYLLAPPPQQRLLFIF